ncbi:hypothetical protein GCM10018793_35570 [Streptomyces sulfonofaciens]|uniref:IPT/TIG domain-containing protein n=1 Tax=Streptomyces sulfonofaciens TaxID=68272 RepID=A0A919GAF6_9ACTN|nr:hypothetical protein [Streptomyces sulfonofaciens]GHH80416.1 hypothetical protein GCM10018793_35570 [Streptomyces sulfonofaciens]
MSYHLCSRARSAAYTALLLTMSILLSALLPIGAAWASGATTATPAAATATRATAIATPTTATTATPAATTATRATGTTTAPRTASAPRRTTANATDCPALPLAPFGDPGSAVGRATVPAQGSACFAFTAEQAALHRVLLDDQHNETAAQVFDGETPLDCYDTEWSSAGWCRLPRAGAFTLEVVNNGWTEDEVSVAVVPLATTTGCEPETGTSWDLGPVTGSAAGPVAVVCHPFTGKAGERVTVDFHTAGYGSSESWITDETGARICPHFNDDDSTGCVLPGDGPYRVLARVTDIEGGFPAAYTLTTRRLSDPAGCADAPVNAYGSAPTTADPATGCRILTAPAAGRYAVYEVQSGARTALAVYDKAGRTVCERWESPCALLAAGDYTLLTDHATLVIDRSSGAGCESVDLGLHQGSLGWAGEIDCLTLPLPAGARTAALKALGGSAPSPDAIAVDADGVQQCDWTTLSEGTCELGGKAPFRVLVSTDDENHPTGSYSLALFRTDVANDCTAVPAGDFTDSTDSARFSTGGGVFARCLSVPADDHSAVENLQLRTVSGTSTAEFSVLDEHGRRVCGITPSLTAWTTCPLTAGAAHTVLVTGRDAAAEYTLTRRDVTATAKGCAPNPATAVGGPSTGGSLGAPGLLHCRKVTTDAAADTLHLNVRDPLGTANITAFDADGKTVCSSGNKSCAVTGSRSYQVLVTVPTYLDAADAYRFDALRIATADGPADECVKVPNISYGYGPITGSLDEQHTAVCAALPTAYRDRFDLAISDTAGGSETAVPSLYNADLDNNCALYIPTGYQCSVDEPYTSEVTPALFVLSLPEKASRTDYSARLDCVSTLCGTEKITVGPVTPTSGESGTKTTVVVTGTALHEDDKVRITLSGRTIESTTTSVADDRKSLKAELDLAGAAAGNWNLSVITHNNWEYLRGTFTVSPAATLRNTAAPTTAGPARADTGPTTAPGSRAPVPGSYAHRTPDFYGPPPAAHRGGEA